MGLDVYLYHYEDHKKAGAARDEYEKKSEANWQAVGGWDGSTEAQKKSVNKKNKTLQKKLGYTFQKKGNDKYSYEMDYLPGETQIEEPSKKHPDHYFKIGYFRSSYNAGGIEHVVGNLVGGSCLYYIFEHEDDEYEFSPDWKKALKRVREVMKKMDEKTKGGAFRICTADFNIFRGVEEYKGLDEQKAMEIFLEQKDRDHSGFSDYSNGQGHFFFSESALKVRALIPGMNALGAPCVYAVYEADDDMKWYREALEIVEETIQYVLSQPDPQKFYLHWSS